MRLQGKIALVTGAASGIGAACEERVSAEAAMVAAGLAEADEAGV